MACSAHHLAACSCECATQQGVSARPPLLAMPLSLPSQTVAMLACVCPQVDYYLALQAGKFIGNSVSTFSAFVILERQWQDRWAGRWLSAWVMRQSRARVCLLTLLLLLLSLRLCRFSAHYNGGHIPLGLFFPFYEDDSR